MVSYFDLILVIPFGLALWRGWKNGLVMEVFSALALFAGLYAAIHFSDWMAEILRDKLDITSKNLPIISFATVFILTMIGLFFLGKVITRSVKSSGAERWNQIGGSLFSLARTVLVLSVFFTFFRSMDQRYHILPKEQREKSIFYEPVYQFSLWLIPAIKDSSYYRQLQQEEHPLQAIPNMLRSSNPSNGLHPGNPPKSPESCFGG